MYPSYLTKRRLFKCSNRLGSAYEHDAKLDAKDDHSIDVNLGDEPRICQPQRKRGDGVIQRIDKHFTEC